MSNFKSGTLVMYVRRRTEADIADLTARGVQFVTLPLGCIGEVKASFYSFHLKTFSVLVEWPEFEQTLMEPWQIVQINDPDADVSEKECNSLDKNILENA